MPVSVFSYVHTYYELVWKLVIMVFDSNYQTFKVTNNTTQMYLEHLQCIHSISSYTY